MKKLLTALLAVAVSGVFAKTIVKGSVDRPDAMYKVGENATFTYVISDDEGKPLPEKAELIFTRDEWTHLQQNYIDLSKVPADEEGKKTVTYQQKLEQPGFLSGRFNFKYLDNGKEKSSNTYTAAGYEPEKLETGVPVPEDFMSYWQGELKKANEQCPLDAKMEKLDQYSNAKHTAYKVSFAAPGGRVYGFLSVPTKPGKHYAVVTVPGAGEGFGQPLLYDDFVQLSMNVHFYDPMIPGKTIKQSYDEIHTAKQSYMAIGGYNRDSNFYHRAILGIYRAVEWLAQRPEVDANRIGYQGSSQGGAFGFILGGFYQKFAAIVCNVPAMCNHLGYKKGSAPGWPAYRWIFGISPEMEANVVYYDAAFFASYITSPIRVSVGFIDTTCSPSSVYAAYNLIKSQDKKIYNCVNMGHSSDHTYNESLKWMHDILKKTDKQ